MKLDILVIAAHPDDAELGCGGTIAKHIAMGHTVGLIDLTEGELGTRGTPELRLEEAADAARILGVSVRENMGFRDGWFRNDEEHQMKLIQKIRTYQPDIILTNAPQDRHPDHGRAGTLVAEAAWLAGLKKIPTTDDKGQEQQAWRPKHVYHFIQYNALEPDFVVDIAQYMDKKIEAVMAFKSQFYNPDVQQPDTLISSPAFMELVKAKMASAGNYALIEYGEGYLSAFKPAVQDLFKLI